MEIPDWLAYRARVAGDRLAVLFEDGAWTFAELDRRACQVAARLAGAGVGQGDRVAVLLPNGPEFVELAFGVARLRAVLVPLNLRLAPAELTWQLADAGARVVVFDASTRELARAALAAWAGGAPPVALSTEELRRLPARGAEELAERPLELEAVYTLMYTSGTTGRPKGVMLTYANHWWSAVASALHLGVDGQDRWLACLPLFHVGGLAILLRSVIYGTTAVVHRRFDPEAVHRAIDQQRITLLSVVGTMLLRMLQDRGGRRYPDHLRAVLVGGGPVAPALVEQALRLAMPVAPTYGLTEAASQVTTLSPALAPVRPASAGQPLLPTRVRIEQDGRPVGAGEVGEIVVRGPTVTVGYWNRPDATQQVLRDGWLHTGDLGYLDAEGFLYVLDRRDDLIISGGENIYPAEVEAVLQQHPEVLEAAVVGVAHPLWGQQPVAVVALRSGRPQGQEDGSQELVEEPAREAALIAFCQAHLARYKLPRRILFTQALPRNASGKLLRARVRELVHRRFPQGLEG